MPFACVTGADHGLGLALASQLLLHGYQVAAGTYTLNSPGLSRLAAEHPDRLFPIPMDIGSDDSIKEAARLIQNVSGGVLDVLINNAGVLGDIEAGIRDELDFDEMQRVFNINALGPLRVIHQLLPQLEAGEGRLIVNISSEAGSIGQARRDRWFAYGMSKAALNMQSKLLHNALAEEQIRVVVLHPGWMQTYMRGTLDKAAELTPEQSAELITDMITNNTAMPDGEGPLYLDVHGAKLPW